jgi:hypothetical protein
LYHKRDVNCASHSIAPQLLSDRKAIKMQLRSDCKARVTHCRKVNAKYCKVIAKQLQISCNLPPLAPIRRQEGEILTQKIVPFRSYDFKNGLVSRKSMIIPFFSDSSYRRIKICTTPHQFCNRCANVCDRCAIDARSLRKCCVIAAQTHNHFATALKSQRNRIANAAQTMCERLAIAVKVLRNRCAIAMKSFVIAAQSLLNRFVIAAQLLRNCY